jgi:hypothetical protein
VRGRTKRSSYWQSGEIPWDFITHNMPTINQAFDLDARRQEHTDHHPL